MKEFRFLEATDIKELEKLVNEATKEGFDLPAERNLVARNAQSGYPQFLTVVMEREVKFEKPLSISEETKELLAQFKSEF